MDEVTKLTKRLAGLEKRLKSIEDRLAPPSKDLFGKDDLYEEAKRVIVNFDNASASFLQRKLSIGYARAARLLDELEADGVVGPAVGAEPRKILVSK